MGNSADGHTLRFLLPKNLSQSAKSPFFIHVDKFMADSHDKLAHALF
jgi:hypothetical protein